VPLVEAVLIEASMSSTRSWRWMPTPTRVLANSAAWGFLGMEHQAEVVDPEDRQA